MQKHLDFGLAAQPAEGELFHPAVSGWLHGRFGAPTEVQRQAWAVTTQHRNALIAAPTGSGKTLAAFLSAINDLVIEGLERGLRDEVHVLYVSPLKALSNDIQKNLQEPLSGIRERLIAMGQPDLGIRDAVRTGDTPVADRERMRRDPPHILVTTPESLFILLTSDSGRRMLSSVKSVIVDELHAVAGSKRGAHLMLTLERLDALCAESSLGPPARIGLSATVKPLEGMAKFLVGDRDVLPVPAREGRGEGLCPDETAPLALTLSRGVRGSNPVRINDVTIINAGHIRERDIAIEMPKSPLTAVMATEVWSELYDRLAELIRQHRTTLIFVNQRRIAERAARHLADRIGEEHVTAHHGSLSKEHRLDAELRLKAGGLKALVATSSLELGIDIGDIDLVCQLGSPRAINAFLQRVGRAGHAIGAIPKGRLFPLSLDDLLEGAALLDAVQRGELDRIRVPSAPLDVLAQQIVAETACREWPLDGLFDQYRRADSYRSLALKDFEQVVQMLADGYSTRRGRRGAYLHYDAVNRVIRARRGAKLTAVMNAGVIPDQFDYDVVLLPEEHRVGTLGEDFAFESLPGDIVQLGNTSYRIAKVQVGKVFVEDAHGQPPSVPFWFGEGLGRSDELSRAVSRINLQAEQMLREGAVAVPDVERWLVEDIGLPPAGAQQLTLYLAASHAAFGALPSADTVIFERFFDEVGDTHLVIHSPFGSRINKAWGLALRKRFCRQFNFELQASALDDSIVLSLGPTHSFPLEDIKGFLKSASAREVLIQALLDAPMFNTRWRWNATAALAIKRMMNGKKVPPQFQRSDSEDLLTVVFPDQVACGENLVGERQIPDHPLVKQTIDDCLNDTMDIVGFERVLKRIEDQQIRIVTCDLAAPSPMSHAILNAKPYAFLDDGEAEARRTRAVNTQPLMGIETAADLGRLDPQAIAQVRAEAQPDINNADELHDALVVYGFLTAVEVAGREQWLEPLQAQRRIAQLQAGESAPLWVAAERLHEWQAILPDAKLTPTIAAISTAPTGSDVALRELMRSRLELLGPISEADLAAPVAVPAADVQVALLQLEAEGAAMRGNFTAGQHADGANDAHAGDAVVWCDRRLLARIHRYSRERLRSEIRAVAPSQFLRFLFRWHGLPHGETSGDERRQGENALLSTLQQLEGCSASAAAWEAELLPSRIKDYQPYMLDKLCSAGRVVWYRPASGVNEEGKRKAGPIRTTPILLCERESLTFWQDINGMVDVAAPISPRATRALEALQAQGASFFADLLHDTGLLGAELELALGELVSLGLVNCDSFAGLRALVTPSERRRRLRLRFNRTGAGIDEAGRWSLARRPRRAVETPGALAAPQVEHIARVLLRRYGVVFRKLLEREEGLPPWRDLFYVYRRLEARGEIRGGRFVNGFSGEQFALPDAAAALRKLASSSTAGDQVRERVSISAADPLNLVGVLTPGEKLPRLPGNRVLFENGVPVALQSGGEVRYLKTLDAKDEWEVKNLLIRRQRPASYVDPATRTQ